MTEKEMTERLSIDDIIDHCERKVAALEDIFGEEKIAQVPIQDGAIAKKYWGHKQVAAYLRELKAIREIVTLKKPDDMDIKGEAVYLCPNCGAEINGKDIDFIYHCCACGQAIDLR